MNKKITVLGAGKIGSYIARQLSVRDNSNDVTVVDPRNIEPITNVKHYRQKINPEDTSAGSCFSVKSIVKHTGADLVINALPGAMGFRVLKEIILAGKHCVDISFMPEDPTGELRSLAEDKGVSVVVDMGVAPGLCGVFVGHEHHHTFSSTESAIITVGGLPYDPAMGYHATFSPADIIEEYTRPARLRRHHANITLPALSDIQPFTMMNHPGDIVAVDISQGFNVFESFLTDGLRTLLTLPIPNMEERTLRYVGYADQMLALKKMGCFNKEHLSLTAKMLESIWRPIEPIREFTKMYVVMHGIDQKGSPLKSELVLSDITHPPSTATSMAQTTGMPAVAMAEILLGKDWCSGGGLFTPEEIGKYPRWSDHIYDALIRENIQLTIQRTALK